MTTINQILETPLVCEEIPKKVVDIVNYHLRQSPEWCMKKHKPVVVYQVTITGVEYDPVKQIYTNKGKGMFAGPLKAQTPEERATLCHVFKQPHMESKLNELHESLLARIFFCQVHINNEEPYLFTFGIGLPEDTPLEKVSSTLSTTSDEPMTDNDSNEAKEQRAHKRKLQKAKVRQLLKKQKV